MQDTRQTFRCTYIPAKLQLGKYMSKCSSLESNLKPGTEFSFKFHTIMRQKKKESTMLFCISVNLRWIVGAIYFGDNLLWLLHSHKGGTFWHRSKRLSQCNKYKCFIFCVLYMYYFEIKYHSCWFCLLNPCLHLINTFSLK